MNLQLLGCGEFATVVAREFASLRIGDRGSVSSVGFWYPQASRRFEAT